MSTARHALKPTQAVGAWPTTRIMFALAGTVSLLSVTRASSVMLSEHHDEET